MRALVTGGMGFIGSNLSRELVRRGDSVTIVDSLIPEYGGNEFNVRDIVDHVAISNADVRDTAALLPLLEDKDVLFNLAGQTSHLDSMSDPETDLEINCKAQLSLLQACREVNTDIKIVFASTRQIYGKPDYLPVDEEHPIRPTDVNGINKTAGEWYHLLYNDIHGIRATVLRLTNTYGPGMRVKDARQTFLGIWLRSLVEGKPFQVFGDGSQKRDLNFVGDVVDALLLVATDGRADGRTYNLGSTEVVSLKGLADMLMELDAGATYGVVPFPDDLRRIDIGDYYADFSRIRDELGWTPKVGLKEGLTTTVAYYRENLEHYI